MEENITSAIKKSEVFDVFLKENNIDCFTKEEQKDDVHTVGSVISTAGTGLMNFRTAEGTMILVNLNGTVVPMGQRVTALGVVTSPAVLTVQFMVSG